MARAALLLLLLLAAAAPAPAADLGTLFHTPEERARLDRLRRGEPPEPVDAPRAREPRPPAVTGYVKRSDGRNTVWVDGTPVATRSDPRTFDPKVVVPKAAPKKEGDATKGGDAAKPGDPGAKQASRPAPSPEAGTKPPAPPGKS